VVFFFVLLLRSEVNTLRTHMREESLIPFIRNVGSCLW